MTGPSAASTRDERFRSFYQRYYTRILRFFVRAFRLSQEDAEELTQEVFLRFYEALDEYRGDAEWAFLETIARNVAYNHIRSGRTAKRNAPTVNIDDREHFHEPAAPQQPDYADRQYVALQRKRLHEAIDTLTPGQQNCIHLHLQDFKYDEIATALRISVDAVKSRLRDAKRTLRARLGDTYALPEVDE